jgi:hypothetical protein
VEYSSRERAGAGESWLGTGGTGTMHPQMAANDIFAVVENAPPQSFVYATLASVVLSLGLYATGRRTAGIFVGLWAPTFISLGLFLKTMRQSRAMR